GDVHHKAVQAPGSRATLLFPYPVVLGAVTGTFEPLGRGTPRHPASEVNTTLIQGDIALLHAVHDGGRIHLGRLVDGARVSRVRIDVGAGLGIVKRHLGGQALLDIAHAPDDNLRAEAAAGRRRPEEG